MNETRHSAACVIFEEKIVVCDGCGYNGNSLNTVESYDVKPDKWSPMPNMNSAKYNHSLVVVKKKLFAISERADTCEVFDNVCKKFVIMKSPALGWLETIRSYSIANNIYVFLGNISKVHVYDTDKNEWSEESCEVTKNSNNFSYVKVPCLY